MTQYIFTDLNFQRPFFLTYVSNSLFVVWLPLLALRSSLRPLPGTKENLPSDTTNQFSDPGLSLSTAVAPTAPVPIYSNIYVLKVAALISFIWFAAQGSYNWSLAGTSVAASTILSNTSSMFTLTIGVLFLKKHLHWLHLIGITLQITGSAVLAAGVSSSSRETVWGTLVCLVSALLYGIYASMFKAWIPSDSASISLAQVFGYIGLFNLVFLLPVVVALHFTGHEDLSAVTPTVFLWLLMKGFGDNFLSDWLWGKAIQLTSPTVATVGISLTIPMAMVGDWLYAGSAPNVNTIVASVAVIAGFIAVAVTGSEILPVTVANSIRIPCLGAAGAWPIFPAISKWVTASAPPELKYIPIPAESVSVLHHEAIALLGSGPPNQMRGVMELDSESDYTLSNTSTNQTRSTK
jgi:solute carrier family 35 protein F5